MPAVRVWCRPATAPGFALAGLRVDELPDPEEARSRLVALLSRGEPGVLLLEEALFETLPDEVRMAVERAPMPVIIPFPGPTWTRPPSAEERVVELLRRAIGYRVRLR